VAALVGVNVVVWMAWMVPFAWPVLNRWFILVPATVRPLSLLGACFSHQGLGHMVANMVVLGVVGTALHEDVGRGNFLAIYTAGGVAGYLASLTRIVLSGRLELTSLGASGCAWGVTMAYFWIHRFEEMKILGLPPEPYSGIHGLAFIGFFLGLHVLAIISKNQVVDIAGHFGGMAVGFVAGKILGDRREAKLKEMEEARLAKRDKDVAPFEDAGDKEDAVEA
jgi:rhomboid-like protein